MSQRERLASDIEQSDAFDRCRDCQTVVVRLGRHRCSDPNPHRKSHTREDRERLAAADDRNPEDSVGVVQRAAGQSYAYHELSDGSPLCGCLAKTKADGIEIVSRAAAKSRSRSPCGNCERIRERRTDD